MKNFHFNFLVQNLFQYCCENKRFCRINYRKKASEPPPPPPPPPQKVDCYQFFEIFEKGVTKLRLPENWQINSSSEYYRILKHDTIHDIPIFDMYIRNNLEFTIRVFAVCIPANHEIYMKFSKFVKNITLSNLVQEISQYCICEGIKNEKPFQYTNQHSAPKIFNPNVTTPSTFKKFYTSTSCSYICKTNICTNCQKFETQKILYEVMNLIPAKTKAPNSKISTERLKLAFQHYRTENKFLKEKIDELVR